MLTSSAPVTMQKRPGIGSIEMTLGQHRVRQCIVEFVHSYKIAPARPELAQRLGMSQHGVDSYLQRLAARGWVRIMPGTARGIVPCRMGVPVFTPEDFRTTTPRVTGRDASAREPDWVECKPLWRHLGETPALCLDVASEGIVALRRTPEEQGETPVRDGETAAVRVGDDVVLGRYHRVDEHTVELRAHGTRPQRPTMRINTAAEDFELIGVVLGRVLAGAG